MKKKLDLLNKKPFISFLILMAFAIFFRIIYFANMQIGFDQVQIIENSKKISQGDLSLIGPRTGPADMFTGPLIYYLSVPFLLLFGEFNMVAFVPLFISVITGIFIYLLIKKYFDAKKANLILAIWAFSPLLVKLDRVFWNPNLTLLSSLLVFVPLYSEKRDKWTWLFLFMGSFLAYQAHFSGFVLLAIALASIVILKDSIKYLFPLILGMGASLVPTVLFDLRNNFLNFNGLLKLVSGSGSGFSLLSLGEKLLDNIYILLEILGGIILFDNNRISILALGLVIFLASLFILKEKKHKLILSWLLMIIVSYAFYSGEKPEYYYLIALPPFLFLLAELLIKLDKKVSCVLLSFFIISSSFINLNAYKKSIGSSIKATAEIKKELESKQVSEIAYDLALGTDFGLKYFLEDIALTEAGNKYHIAEDYQTLPKNTKYFGTLGLWEDLRDSSKNTFNIGSYFISTEANYFLHEDQYQKDVPFPFESYIIMNEDKIIGNLDFAVKSDEMKDWRIECKRDESSNHQHFINDQEYCLRMNLNAGFSLDEIDLKVF